MLPAERLRLPFPAVVCSEALLQRSVPDGGTSLAVVESTTAVSMQRKGACNSSGTIASLARAAA
jgi:hypothetical protein